MQRNGPDSASTCRVQVRWSAANSWMNSTGRPDPVPVASAYRRTPSDVMTSVTSFLSVVSVGRATAPEDPGQAARTSQSWSDIGTAGRVGQCRVVHRAGRLQGADILGGVAERTEHLRGVLAEH